MLPQCCNAATEHCQLFTSIATEKPLEVGFKIITGSSKSILTLLPQLSLMLLPRLREGWVQQVNSA